MNSPPPLTPPKPMRLLVCGGRDYADRAFVFKMLDALHGQFRNIAEIIHGGAPGADALAGEWARANGVKETVVPANWAKHGRAAGPIRNQIMADMLPDNCLAFPGGHGTADMVARAKAAGIVTFDVAHDVPTWLRAGAKP